MNRLFRLAFIALLASVGACSGGTGVTCDEEQYYQRAELAPRVVAPDDLDPLDPNRELPLPEASPRPPREAGSPCFDRPPEIELGE